MIIREVTWLLPFSVYCGSEGFALFVALDVCKQR
jgi:hypothetical protein